MKKICYVSDNRNRPNWGCRATSMAMHDLLKERFDVSHVIYGDVVSGPQSVGVPKKAGKFIEALRRRPMFSFANSVAGAFGIHFDISDHDPRLFAENIIRHQNRNSVCKRIVEAVQETDAVAFNGEGDMIFTNPPRRKFLFFLAVMELSLRFKKPFFYVNAMASDCPRSGRNTNTFSIAAKLFSRNCMPVILRDPTSASLVEEMKANCPIEYLPDALFTWSTRHSGRGVGFSGIEDYVVPFPEYPEVQESFNFQTPYVCVGGSSSAAWDQGRALISYRRMIELLKTKFGNVVLVESCNGDRFLRLIASDMNLPFIPVKTGIHVAAEVLANASLFISGRYHPSILASLGGTPCVFLGSNAHKTKSLQAVLGYDDVVEFSDCPTSDELNGIAQRGQSFIEGGDELRSKIRLTVSGLDSKAKTLAGSIERALGV